MGKQPADTTGLDRAEGPSAGLLWALCVPSEEEPPRSLSPPHPCALLGHGPPSQLQLAPSPGIPASRRISLSLFRDSRTQSSSRVSLTPGLEPWCPALALLRPVGRDETRGPKGTSFHRCGLRTHRPQAK